MNVSIGWKEEEPYKFTKAIHNYAATNLIPRHLGPEYVIHGAKLYSPWDPARTDITLVSLTPTGAVLTYHSTSHFLI